MEWWKQTKARWDEVKAEYGRIAIWTYLTLWVLVLLTYFLAIQMGLEVDVSSETTSALVGAWVAAKVTQPARILLTIVLTPVVARVLRKEPVRVGPETE